MPKTFSVVTINYNNLKGLQRTFESVVNQTRRDEVEFIVVDGASGDGSQEFLEEKKDKIDVSISEKDKGIYDAMNKGLEKATGKFVWFVNSGDAIYNNSVVENALELAKENPEIIFGDTMFVNSNGNEIGLISKLKPQKFPEQLNKNSFRFGMNICHQSFIAKREICPKYDLQYKQASDIDWILKILQKNPLNLKYKGIISSFETGGSSTQNEKKAWKERYKVLEKYYGKLSNLLAHLFIIIRRIIFKIFSTK